MNGAPVRPLAGAGVDPIWKVPLHGGLVKRVGVDGAEERRRVRLVQRQAVADVGDAENRDV